MAGTQRWVWPFRDRTARRFGYAGALIFVVLYLYSVDNIVIAPGLDLAAGRSVPSILIASDWPAKIWKAIAPFVWEPIAAIYPLRSVAIFLSVPNLLLAFTLGTLVGLNLSVAVARARLMAPGGRRGDSLSGVLASVPALLTGFTCCVPTIFLALGSVAAGFTVATIAVAPYFLPVAALALVLNLSWSMRQYACSLSPRG